MKHTIYIKSTGQIEKIVSAPADMLSLQFNADTHGSIEGSFDDSGFYIEAARPVAMPTKPSEYHVFDYTTKQWTDPRTPDSEWPLIRFERDRRLAASDWTQLPDVPLATKQTWAAYRQALRDVTEQPDPFNIVWPAAPG